MSIHFQINVDGETAQHAIDELRQVFGALMAGQTFTPTAANEALKQAAAADDVKTGEIIEPEKKTRKSKKDKEPETIDGKAEAPLADASTAGKTPSGSTSSEQDNSTTSASDASSVPDIDAVRTALKTLGATDGLGTDKVFELLGKYGAKNASTVPEDKRAELIAEIEELLKGAK